MAEQPERIVGLFVNEGGVHMGLNGGVHTSLRVGDPQKFPDLSMTEEARGIRLRWSKGNILVAWSHIRQVDYANPAQLRAATPQK